MHHRRIEGLDKKILSLYAKGMRLSDIKTQLEELYGAHISESLISKITDNVMDEVILWQSRPLESVYPIVYFDCLVLKVLIVFLAYPDAIRWIIYTTNTIESVNSQFRKVTKNKRVFPNDAAVFKILYLTVDYMTKKWTIAIKNWNMARAHFMIKFQGRI